MNLDLECCPKCDCADRLRVALDECRRQRDRFKVMSDRGTWRKRAEAAERFSRWKDSIEQTLVYVSNNVLEPEHAEQIRIEVNELLKNLGVK